ncbi:hypothetical protein CUP1828 [Campylobacter upsaliensis RM3195]|nr:hypothetical protein [Campylobacter upsaliensis]EAL53629.1 hypothetical protein CUP1828 [Campylobacter upsaliensis RM3195]MCR2104871.1 hypothetical protein [Campylobacter upsaliensis]
MQTLPHYALTVLSKNDEPITINNVIVNCGVSNFGLYDFKPNNTLKNN